MANKFDIAEFRTKVEKSYHRAAHFNMITGIPNGLRRGVGGDFGAQFNETSKTLHFDIEAANLPGIAMATDEVRRKGVGAFDRIPYVPIFDTIDITVRSDVEGKVYDYFQSWMKLIINYDTRDENGETTGLGSGAFGGAAGSAYEVAYKNDYTTESIINVYDVVGGNEDPTIAVHLKDCYPIHVGNIPLSWAANDIIRFPVTLTFTDWFQEKNIKAAGNTATSNTAS